MSSQERRRVNLNLPAKEYDRCEAIASEAGISMTSYIRQAMHLKYLVDTQGYRLIDENQQVHNFIFTQV